ncbi:hypothetical protein DRE_06457 [Drechslerella stenobrocha 248]|uniref:Uncharacterized protein n=1 Tax=Drechslerella stenobrocha 248 TaxID=1043628 RepID=W7HNV3_9PEZI|nr:hypothetical protein DRE_06457 [Drechslerella stenobrocha 248]
MPRLVSRFQHFFEQQEVHKLHLLGDIWGEIDTRLFSFGWLLRPVFNGLPRIDVADPWVVTDDGRLVWELQDIKQKLAECTTWLARLAAQGNEDITIPHYVYDIIKVTIAKAANMEGDFCTLARVPRRAMFYKSRQVSHIIKEIRSYQYRMLATWDDAPYDEAIDGATVILHDIKEADDGLMLPSFHFWELNNHHYKAKDALEAAAPRMRKHRGCKCRWRRYLARKGVLGTERAWHRCLGNHSEQEDMAFQFALPLLELLFTVPAVQPVGRSLTGEPFNLAQILLRKRRARERLRRSERPEAELGAQDGEIELGIVGTPRVSTPTNRVILGELPSALNAQLPTPPTTPPERRVGGTLRGRLTFEGATLGELPLFVRGILGEFVG